VIQTLIDFAAAAWAFAWTADFAGLVFGVAGTLLLATKGRLAGWGFVAFLASNAGWLAFAQAHGHTKLLAQHVIFAASSLIGVYVWLIKDRLAAALDRVFISDPYDTHRMEDEIFARFNGRNAQELAQQYGTTATEVLDIVISGQPTSPKAMAAGYVQHGRQAGRR
jgi:hypothetical protein